MKTPTKGDKDDLVDTDNDQDANNEESQGNIRETKEKR